MISFVTFLWKGNRPNFSMEHVSILHSMITRHYARPFKFICFTDSPGKELSHITQIKLWNEPEIELSPSRPNCYRRLKLFSPDIRNEVPELTNRVVCLDLDLILLSDCTEIFDTPGDFVGYNKKGVPIQGAFWIHELGTRPAVWLELTKEKAEVARKRWPGSDQSWLSVMLKDEKVLTKKEGLYCYDLAKLNRKEPTPEMKIVFFRGGYKPWHPKVLKRAWIKEHYK